MATARAWDAGSGRQLGIISGRFDRAAFSPSGDVVVTAGRRVTLWAVYRGGRLATIPTIGTVAGAAFDERARSLLVADAAGVRMFACRGCGDADALRAAARR